MTGRVTAKKAKAKVGLVMIVRDEEAILRERLEAVRGEIDWWLIVDTGSKDRTPEIPHEVYGDDGDIPGTLVFREWRGFADARTAAVREAAKWHSGDWALLLDADTIFHVGAEGWVKAYGEAVDAIQCEVRHGSIRYSHPRVLKLGAQEWRWRGVLHEYLEIPAGARVVDSSLIWVEHGSGGARSKGLDKFRKDALLLAEARDQIERDPEHEDRDLLPRYTFYEAQSWRDTGRWRSMAEAAYLARTSMGGFFEEVQQAWMNVAALREAKGELAGAIEAYLAAWAVDPRRAEPLIGLATVHRVRCQWAPAYAFAWLAYQAASVGPVGMFADVNVGWRADFELGVAGWYVDHLYEGRRACERVLASELAPEGVKATARANLELYP